ncbi:uncharacterized protein RJT21DRAFT_2609 [Scheffersomyces amazonensis]|uniref:uncharacterized protein n=1 Tax=Scheffersomyces amazonensis TaxID=1078765 RepID=UPI00315D932E
MLEEVLFESNSHIPYNYVNSCFNISVIFFTSLALSQSEDGSLEKSIVKQLQIQFEFSFLPGILEFLSYKFDSADVIPDDDSSGVVRPDLGIWHFNSSVFQMLTYHSEIGFLIDRSSIIIIRIKSSKIVNQLVNRADSSLIKVLDCAVLCLEHSTNGNNLGSILISYLADYFQNITLQRTTAIEELFRSFQLSADQKHLMMVSRVNFVREEWLKSFSNYRLVDNCFVHDSHPDISIPREIFELKDLIEDWKERNENEFEIVRNLRDGEPINGYFSKVFLSRFRGTNRDIVLKVYDPMSTPVLDREIGLADREFYSVFSYILEMFFSEVRAYLTIRGVPNGTDNSPPDSGSGNKSLNSLININYTPFLYDFGYFSGSMGSGFYLVEEFIIDQELNCETEHFNTLAREALTKVHQIGLIHGDIHAGNLIYERRRD